MNCTTVEAAELAAQVRARVPDDAGVEVALAPTFTALAAVHRALDGSFLLVAAQDMHWADAGAFTGAVGVLQVREHASLVILGHSERRLFFGETNDDVNRKVHAAFDHGLSAVVCVGETGAERDAGATDDVVRRQTAAATDGLRPREAARLVVAYEPVWAIGSGRPCDATEAARVVAAIRGVLAGRFGAREAQKTRLLYGGSVTAANAQEYFAVPDIDGALVGGAALDADDFAAIVAAARVPPGPDA